MTALSFILWEARPEIWPDGPIPLRWYGLMFAAAFALGQYIISYIFKRDGKAEKDVDSLTYHMIIGTILGDRLGHILFYQPDY
jgi:prolipoprotein diacylglyceryltransferase